MKVYDAVEFEGRQSELHKIYGAEGIIRAFREVNRQRKLEKLRALKVLVPSKDSNGNSCDRCGSLLSKDCKTGCGTCGYKGG